MITIYIPLALTFEGFEFCPQSGVIHSERFPELTAIILFSHIKQSDLILVIEMFYVLCDVG